MEETFGDIIYDHFLFDITRLMDLCALYHTCNQPLLTKMINNIFKRQPRYQDDLKSALNSVLKLLEDVTVECVGRGMEAGKTGSVERLVLYVADIASSLRSFMETYPPSVSFAVECGLLKRCVCDMVTCTWLLSVTCVRRLVLFYEETIPRLQEQWLARKCSSEPERYV